MKKILSVSVLALFLSIIIPLNVKALDAEIFAASTAGMTETTEGENTFAIKYKSGSATKLYLAVNVKEGTLTEYNVHVELKNSKFKFSGKTSDRQLYNNWEGTVTSSDNGNGVDVKLTNKTGFAAGTRKVIASITLTVDESATDGDTCEIVLEGEDEEPPVTTETPKCKVVNGKYYDANGNEVSEEAYNEACTTSENPQTNDNIMMYLTLGLISLSSLAVIIKKYRIN